MLVKFERNGKEVSTDSIVITKGAATYYLVENEKGALTLCKRVQEISADSSDLKVTRKVSNIVEFK